MVLSHCTVRSSWIHNTSFIDWGLTQGINALSEQAGLTLNCLLCLGK
jgi:hypothetical protein